MVGIITITNGGSGYAEAPSVTISSPGIGTTATATAYINSSGSVTSIRITDTGIGYTSIPTIQIDSPIVSGIGTFIFNEIVTGSVSGTTAIVNSWNSVTNELKVSKVTGSFTAGENIVGSESGASRKLRILEEYDTTDPYAQNEIIENEADSILDFSEGNPFGTP